MRLTALKHQLKLNGKATVDTITFKVNADTQKFINKEKKAGRLEETQSELYDNYIELKVIEKEDE